MCRLRFSCGGCSRVEAGGHIREEVLTTGALLFGEERKKESGLIKAAPRGRKVSLQDSLSGFYETSRCNYCTLSQRKASDSKMNTPTCVSVHQHALVQR